MQFLMRGWERDSEWLARWSYHLGMLGCLTIVIPWMPIILGIAAFLCGCSGEESCEDSRARAGKALGIGLMLIGMTILVVLSTLQPYLPEIAEVFAAVRG